MAKGCKEPGCGRTGDKQGLCHSHYERARRRGLLKIRPRDQVERFWSYVNKGGPPPSYRPSLGGCWLWGGTMRRSGYGQIYFDRRLCAAHRVCYELVVGPIPEGLHLDHLCRNRACVNPQHLEPVTAGENLRRGFGASGLNARKTHCAQGHEYSAENTQLTRSGGRRCRECARRLSAAHNAAQVEANRNATRTENCTICGLAFTYPGNRLRRYCSDACRRKGTVASVRRYRERVRLRETA